MADLILPLILPSPGQARPPAAEALAVAGLDTPAVPLIPDTDPVLSAHPAVGRGAHIFSAEAERPDPDAITDTPRPTSRLFQLSALPRVFRAFEADFILAVPGELSEIFWPVTRHGVLHRVPCLSLPAILRAACEYLRSPGSPGVLAFPAFAEPPPLGDIPGALLIARGANFAPVGDSLPAYCSALDAALRGSSWFFDSALRVVFSGLLPPPDRALIFPRAIFGAPSELPAIEAISPRIVRLQ